MYDTTGRLVDSIYYALTTKSKSYSRKMPNDSIWDNNSDLTIGYHNTFYTNSLSEIQKDKDRKSMFMIVGISSIVVIIGIIGIFLYRRKKSISQS